MPDTISVPLQNTLPLWDSFEATFFVLSGMSVGFVFGYLFPSIWRTFRRRFQSHRRHIIEDIPWQRKLDLDLKILDIQSDLSKYELVELFVIARDMTQRGEFRHAIKVYGQILTSELVTTPFIHRAMFELSQVYFSLGLYIRTFDTAFEVFKRKSNDPVIFQFLLIVLTQHIDEEKLYKTFRVFRGEPSELLRNQMSYLVCHYASLCLAQEPENLRSINLSRFALKIDPEFSYARFILWRSLSVRTRKKKSLNIKAKWVAFAADFSSWINLCKETELSTFAGAPYLYKLIAHLLHEDLNLECFNSIKSEFLEILNLPQILQSSRKTFLDSFLDISIILQIEDRSCEKSQYKIFLEQLFIKNESLKNELFPFFLFSKENIFVNDIINPNILKIGLQAHHCKSCKAIFVQFQWLCEICGSYEPLTRYVSPFMEYAYNNDKNWHSYQDNRNRCVDSYSSPK